MARTVQEYRVFVASPSDVKNERVRLEEVIKETNKTWGQGLGFRLELVRWETDVHPGIGADAQEVINTQIAGEYDIFIGIMWCRFGSPTARASSGTQEEFLEAVRQMKTDRSLVEIMMYFKDAPISPNQIDAEQLRLVKEFKTEASKQGVLYTEFESTEQFEQMVRVHLANVMQERLGSKGEAKSQALPKADDSVLAYSPDQVGEPSSDEGILDALEIFGESMKDLEEITLRIDQATRSLNNKIDLRTSEVEVLKNFGGGGMSQTSAREEAKKILLRTAQDMNLYAARMDPEVEQFGIAASEGFGAFIRGIGISVDLSDGKLDVEDMRQTRVTVSGLREKLSYVAETLHSFKEIVDDTPPLVRALSQAKRRVSRVLEQLISELETAMAILSEADEMIARALRD